MELSSKLIKWYKIHKRDLPWRHTNDAYKIWLSEIILQQTRVEQGLNYYLAFSSKYPDATSLAKAKEDDVLKLWQGLGYYSRARNMHFTAKEVVANYGGKFPTQYAELLKLKGIGPYSAAAIASISAEENVAVVDGNVIRVISRIYGITEAVDSSETLKKINLFVNTMITGHKPSDFNQAIMEFGALHCTPKNPACLNCIFIKECKALAENIVDEIPFKQKKPSSRKRYFYYFVASVDSISDLIIFKQRINKDIWQNLFDFPLIEADSDIVPDEKFIATGFKKLFGKYKFTLIDVSKKYIHKLTHQEIVTVFICLNINAKTFKPKKPMVLISNKTIKKYAVPRLIEKYISEHQL